METQVVIIAFGILTTTLLLGLAGSAVMLGNHQDRMEAKLDKILERIPEPEEETLMGLMRDHMQ